MTPESPSRGIERHPNRIGTSWLKPCLLCKTLRLPPLITKGRPDAPVLCRRLLRNDRIWPRKRPNAAVAGGQAEETAEDRRQLTRPRGGVFAEGRSDRLGRCRQAGSAGESVGRRKPANTISLYPDMAATFTRWHSRPTANSLRAVVGSRSSSGIPPMGNACVPSKATRTT